MISVPNVMQCFGQASMQRPQPLQNSGNKNGFGRSLICVMGRSPFGESALGLVECKVTAKLLNGQVTLTIKEALFSTLVGERLGVDLQRRCPMTDTPLRRETSLDIFELTRCCAEAQADGVPCPTLGRSCEVCERALRDDDAPPPSIRPVGSD